ncbi:MAG: hypothetical protein HETSPECPRED_005358 [Heterodermia speciosa]|uniref:Uncharacterized protein n=1 Tax=Heterodermia speciosa TaxID=116794 RepID=A0A8H3ILN9_9LECA|nr:MAG: hypothetical protein HETSPECPRED_005358 [Heterodermia speciosa]
MQVVVVTLMALAYAALSAAAAGLTGRDVAGVLAPQVKDIGARQVYDTIAAPIVARDKETVTVTVTADCTTGPVETPVVTGVSVSTGPVVIVPGTQSETGTFSIPAGGATITPGVSGNVPVPSTAEVSTAATPSPELPAPGNATSVATSESSAPVTSTGTTTTAVSTKSSTSSKSTTVESTSTEASASAVPTPSATTTPATGAAVDNFAEVYMALAVAMIGSVALLI